MEAEAEAEARDRDFEDPVAGGVEAETETDNTSKRPELSVILCTYNPRKDFLAMALRSVGAQTLDYPRWEFIVVDNNSVPALSEDWVASVAGCPVRLVTQPTQGLTHARIAGLSAARAEIIVFLDDDNELQSDYLEKTLLIARSNPAVGAFGGIADGVLERQVGRFRSTFLPELGIRNYGDERIEGDGNEWGQWEPIGAGMVVRREVGQAFIDFVAGRTEAGALGRTGNNLMSGEDSLFSRLADGLGFRCSYEPALRLRHYMSANRLTLRYLARLVYGHGRSHVVLASVLGSELDKPCVSKSKLLMANFLHRVREESITSAVGMMFWDAGYYDALSELPESRS